MPAVPRYGVPQVQASNLPGVRLSDNNANAADFGGDRGMGAFARVAGAVGEHMQQEADEARLMEFETNQSHIETELLHDPEKGALALRGKDAIGSEPRLWQEWDHRNSDALNALPARLRQRALQLVNNRRTFAERTVASHVLQESERYADDQATAMAQAATDEIGLHYQDPERIGKNLASIEAATQARFRGDSPEKVSQAVHAAKSNAMRLVLERYLQDSPQAGQAALEQYRDQLDAPDLIAFTGRLNTELEQQANRAITAQAKRETQAERSVQKVEDAAATGLPMTPEALGEHAAIVKGTEAEADFHDAVARMGEVQKVRGAPFADQARYIDGLEAQLHQGSADPKKEQTRLNTLRSALESSRKQAKENPVGFYESISGEQTDPVDLNLLMSPGGAEIAQSRLAGRYVAIDAMRRRFGPEVGHSPWRPEEAEALRTSFARPEMPTEAKVQMLGMLAKAAPDAASFRDTIAPLAMTDRISYLAGMEQYAGHNAGANGPIAPLLLQGQKVLADKSVQMPSEKKFSEAFDEDIGPAYAPGSPERRDAYLRFKTLYAALLETVPPKGRSNEPDELAEDLRKRVGDLATGGIAEHAGAKTVMPWGMKPEVFTDKLDAALHSTASATGFPVETLSDLPILGVPGYPGVYFMLNAGRAQIDPSTGKPVLLKIQ